MRVAWKDELFVKDGRNIQATLHAQNLWDQVREPLILLTEAVNHFSSIANLIKRSDLICVTPISAVAAEIIAGEIAATKPPIEIMPQQISAIWHKRQDTDQGLIWLQEHVKRIISRIVESETAQVMQSLCKHNPSMCK